MWRTKTVVVYSGGGLSVLQEISAESVQTLLSSDVDSGGPQVYALKLNWIRL